MTERSAHHRSRKAQPARCFGCQSTKVNLQRGWVRGATAWVGAGVDDRPTYWLCDTCLDRLPALEWSYGVPTITHYERKLEEADA